MISWHHFTNEPPWPIPNEGEPYAAVKLGREYAAVWERSNRPEVVAHLERLLATVRRLRPVEVYRDPAGVLSPPPVPVWEQTGEAA